MNAGMDFGCEQTDKREWRAWVYWAGKRHWIGYRDHQADAQKAAAAVYWSLRGNWEGSAPSKLTLLNKYRHHFSADAFRADESGDRGELRERDDWVVAAFSRSLTADARAEIETFLEERWCGSRQVRDGQLCAVGIGDPFVIAMGELLKISDKNPKPTPQTEEMPKVASGGRENKGLSADKIETRYPSMGLKRVRAEAATGAGFACEHCGAEMFRPSGRFCSDRCRKAASRLAVSP